MDRRALRLRPFTDPVSGQIRNRPEGVVRPIFPETGAPLYAPLWHRTMRPTATQTCSIDYAVPLKPQDLVFLDRASHQMLWSSPDRTWRGAPIGALTADRTGRSGPIAVRPRSSRNSCDDRIRSSGLRLLMGSGDNANRPKVRRSRCASASPSKDRPLASRTTSSELASTRSGAAYHALLCPVQDRRGT